MKRKLLRLLLPILGWRSSTSILSKINLIITSIIAFWFYTSLMLFIYLNVVSSEINKENMRLNFIGSPKAFESYMHKELNHQYTFLTSDLLFSSLPVTNVYFIESRLLFSWFLGPYTLWNYFKDVEGMAFTPLFSSVILMSRSNKENSIIASNLAHELVHILQHDKYGYFTTRIKTPTWVAEGYSVYRQSLFTGEKIDDLYISGSYKFYGAMVKNALLHDDNSIDELFLGKIDYKNTLKSLCQNNLGYWGCKNNTSNLEIKDENY